MSFGLSVAVVPLIGLILNYAPWGIRLVHIFISLFVFIAAMSAVAFYRRRKLPAEERYFPDIEMNLPRWSGLSGLEKVLTVVLIMAVLFAAGSIYYLVATPKTGKNSPNFTSSARAGKPKAIPGKLKPVKKAK